MDCTEPVERKDESILERSGVGALVQVRFGRISSVVRSCNNADSTSAWETMPLELDFSYVPDGVLENQVFYGSP